MNGIDTQIACDSYTGLMEILIRIKQYGNITLWMVQQVDATPCNLDLPLAMQLTEQIRKPLVDRTPGLMETRTRASNNTATFNIQEVQQMVVILL